MMQTIPGIHRAPEQRYFPRTGSYLPWPASPQGNKDELPRYLPAPPLHNQSRQSPLNAEISYPPPPLNASIASSLDTRLEIHNRPPHGRPKTTTDNFGRTLSYPSYDFTQQQRLTPFAGTSSIAQDLKEDRSRRPWSSEDHTWYLRRVSYEEQLALPGTRHVAPHINLQPELRTHSHVSRPVSNRPDFQSLHPPYGMYRSSLPYPSPKAPHKPLPIHASPRRIRHGLGDRRPMYPTKHRKFSEKRGSDCWFWNYSKHSCRFRRDECKRFHRCSSCGSPSHGCFYSYNGIGCQSAQHRYHHPSSLRCFTPSR
ncbi:hypothetical protein IG631_23956 [Alternaria alternata]|nr:hypothetical protein IG631_23956 [Alternaria alternata]